MVDDNKPENKTIVVDLGKKKSQTQVNQQANPEQRFINSKFKEVLAFREVLSAVPTYKPKNFFEQFALVDDGTKKLYVYINNVWTLIGP